MVACAVWVPSALAARPGVKPQWTFAQFVLNDRMTLSVNVEGGNLNLAARDIDVGGNLGPQADFWRYYNSLNVGTPTAGDLAWGWSTNAGPDVKLSGTYGSDITFYGPTGYQAPFVWNGTGYKLATGIGGQLTHNTDGSWEVWMYRGGIKYEFSSAGVLTSTKDLSGNTLTNGYTSGLLTSLVSQQGVTDTITETSGQISGASAPPSSVARTWGYSRDANGNLHTYTGPDGYVTTYTYDGTGRHLTQIDDPEGRRTIIGYDSSSRATSVKQVTNNTTNAGDTTTFVYTPGSIVVGGVTYGGKTVVTDPNGYATTYYYDINTGDVERTDDPLGHVQLAMWTANDDPMSTTDALTNAKNFTYTNAPTGSPCPQFGDALYRPCLQSGTHGVSSKETYNDATNPYLPYTTTDTRGVQTQYTYAPSTGLLTQVTDGDSKNTTFSNNNTNGTLAKVTNPNTLDTTFGYYADASLEDIVTDSTIGAELLFDYDTAYRVTCFANEDGSLFQMRFYDDYDRLTTTNYDTDCSYHSDGSAVTRTYDKSGNLKTLITYDTSGAVVASTTYTYDLKNRLTQEAQTAPFSATTNYTYDGDDNIKTIANAGGTTTYNYDNADRLTSIVEPGPFATSFGYDNADRLTSTTYPNGVVESYTVDGNGNVTRLTAAKGATTLLDLEYNYCLSSCGLAGEIDSSLLQSVRNHLSPDRSSGWSAGTRFDSV